MVVFQGDRKVLLGDMVRILNTAKAAGAPTIAIGAKRATSAQLANAQRVVGRLIRYERCLRMAADPKAVRGGGVFADINITPLTDIFLVLLIIFMVTTAVTIESAAHVDLPKAEARRNPNEKPKGIIVTYTADHQIMVNRPDVTLPQLQGSSPRCAGQVGRQNRDFPGRPEGHPWRYGPHPRHRQERGRGSNRNRGFAATFWWGRLAELREAERRNLIRESSRFDDGA